MRSRLATIIALCAWLLATGSHWDLVQTFAWGKMIATYAQTMPLARAVQLTFTADNLCGVCEIVSDAKQDPASPVTAPANPTEGKVLLALASPHAVILGLAELSRFPHASTPPLSHGRPAPPSEPPRAV
ncbi:MAG: hypothetical protein ABII82_10870 [Verrucomicrobiota bacterium]